LACLDIPAFSVQFHPEAAAGPHDAAPLFDRFSDLMDSRRTQTGTAAESDAEPAAEPASAPTSETTKESK
ncbi:MAG: carbamoyl phosphate synthase small subunit, partial [Arthrobacter sp.]